MCDQCEKTLYGCCPDLQNAAAGMLPSDLYSLMFPKVLPCWNHLTSQNTQFFHPPPPSPLSSDNCIDIFSQYSIHSGPEFAGCPDEDGELYEDCTLTE